MTDKASDVDPQVVDDLRIVEQACQTLGACGARAEFWEAFTLLKTGRELFQVETDRLAAARLSGAEAKINAALIEKLGQIKIQLSPLARQLREFLGKSPAGILDGMKQDLALVFLMGSAKARQSVSRWVTDPSGSAGESTLRLKILSRLVDSYRRALLDARRQPVLPVTAPDTTVRSMTPSTVKLKPEFVDDLRCVERCRRMLQASDGGLGWELVCLILAQRDETRRSIEELEQLNKSGKPGEFAGASYRFRSQLKQIREQYESLATPIRAYLRGLYGSYAGESDELALAFLVASSQGRHRARQWLDDPELCRGEATASMNGLRGRATSYLDAMRNLPAAAKAQAASRPN
jgi:hypothetical protein